METKAKATTKEGLEKGYLENKKVTVRPVPRYNALVGNNKDHVLYFMQDGASMFFVLPRNNYNELYPIFKDEEEMRFFSELIGQDLNLNNKQNNFWESFSVKITKDVTLMKKGKEFNLADPLDNLRIRILRLYDTVTEGWDKKYSKPKSKFCIVDSDFEETQSNKDMDIYETIYTYWGEIKTSVKKMRDFLIVYYMTKKSTKQVPSDWSKEQLTKEIKDIIDKDKEAVYSIITDKDAEMKLFISRAVRCGAIERKGVTGYIITGEEEQRTLPEMIKYLEELKETTDTTYIKIDTQIKQAKL